MIAPNDPEAYNDRGIAYSNIGENDKAIADYTEAISLNPPSSLLAATYWNRGMVYIRQNEYEKASLDTYEAGQLDPATYGIGGGIWDE